MALPCGPCNIEGGVPEICGDFDNTTDTPDLGLCHPYRVKIDCGAPILPVIPCADDQYSVAANPDYPDTSDNPFIVTARLFDQNCLTIQDQNGADILTYIS